MDMISQNHDVGSTKIYSDTLSLSLQEYYSEAGLLKSLSVQLDDVAFTFEKSFVPLCRYIATLFHRVCEMDERFNFSIKFSRE